MKLGAFKCDRCIGVVLIDIEKLLPNAIVSCPYCSNKFIPRLKAGSVPQGEMLPSRVTLRCPDSFDAASVALQMHSTTRK